PPVTEAMTFRSSDGVIRRGPPQPPGPLRTITGRYRRMAVLLRSDARSTRLRTRSHVLATGQQLVGDQLGDHATKEDDDDAHEEVPQGEGTQGQSQLLHALGDAKPDEEFGRVRVGKQSGDGVDEGD